MWDSHWAGHASIWLFYCPQVPSALAFQSATHNITSFINLTNMSISNNNKFLDKCILRVNCVALYNKSWLLHRQCVYTVATVWTYVRSVCTVWSYVCSVCIERTVLLVPLILLVIVNVLVDTSAQIKVTKGPERGQNELSKLLSQHFAAATTVCLWKARM